MGGGFAQGAFNGGTHLTRSDNRYNRRMAWQIHLEDLLSATGSRPLLWRVSTSRPIRNPQ